MIMKKNIYIILSILLAFPLHAKIEILDRVAIIVGEGVVLESQVNNMLANIEKRYQEQGAPMPPQEALLEQVQERLIIEELQLQMGRQAGIRVGDGELNQAFENIAQTNGLSLEEFIKTLEAEGESYEELRSQVRKEMIIQRVQRGKVGRAVDITEQELDGFLATEGAVKELSPELFVRQILVPDQNKADSLLIKINNGEDFAELAKENLKSGSGFYILKLEDKRGDLVRFEDQWNVRHILMMTTKLRDETFTKKELEEVRKRVLDGEDFGLLAKEFSEDPGSASRGGDLDWLSRGKTAPAFEKMMLESPVGEISPVFESEFGFHFLEVLDTRTEDLTEEVIKDRAYGILFARKFDEELENTLRTTRAEAFVEFKELD